MHLPGSSAQIRVGNALSSVVNGRWGHLLRWPYAALVATQLRLLARRDARIMPPLTPDERARLAGQVSVILKTFERPKIARRCVRSLRGFFDGPIVIADDSQRPMSSDQPGLSVLALPFNSGVGVGRNAALAQVRTPYVLVSDDDSVFTRALNLPALVSYLEANPQVDAIAPLNLNLPRLWVNSGGRRNIAGQSCRAKDRSGHGD